MSGSHTLYLPNLLGRGTASLLQARGGGVSYFLSLTRDVYLGFRKQDAPPPRQQAGVVPLPGIAGEVQEYFLPAVAA